MSKLKKAFSLLAAGEFQTLFRKCWTVLKRVPYKIRARIEDGRIGTVSINKKKPSKYGELGAYATESTDYRWLDQIFKEFPIRENDVFVDVGCGEGRVLTYLYLRGFHGEMTGIELDRAVANTAIARTKKCSNIQIHCGNVLECGEFFKRATAVYLFNPFNEQILAQFIQMVEEHCNHRIILYYCNDLYRRVLDKKEHWWILRRNKLRKIESSSRNHFYTVYEYRPGQ